MSSQQERGGMSGHQSRRRRRSRRKRRRRKYLLPRSKQSFSKLNPHHLPEFYCNPDICPNCLYIGEGDSVCEVTHKIVLSDWVPTDDFMGEGCVYAECLNIGKGNSGIIDNGIGCAGMSNDDESNANTGG